MADTPYQGLEENKYMGIRRLGMLPAEPVPANLFQRKSAQLYREKLHGVIPDTPDNPADAYNRRRQLIDLKLNREYPDLTPDQKTRIYQSLGLGEQQDPGDFSRKRGFFSSAGRALEAGWNMLSALPDAAEAFYGYVNDDPQTLLSGLKGIEEDVRENQQIYDFEFNGNPGEANAMHKFAFDALASAPAMAAGIAGGAIAGKAIGLTGAATWLAGLLGYGASDALLEGGFNFIDVVSDPVIRKKITDKLKRDLTGDDIHNISQLVSSKLVEHATDAAGRTAAAQFFIPTNFLAGKFTKFVPLRGAKGGAKGVIYDIANRFKRVGTREFAEEAMQSGISQTSTGAAREAADSGEYTWMEGVKHIDPKQAAYEGLLGLTMGTGVASIPKMPGGWGESKKEYWEGGADYRGEGDIRSMVRAYINEEESGLIELDKWLIKDADDSRTQEIINSELSDMTKGKQLLGTQLDKEDIAHNKEWANKYLRHKGEWKDKVKPMAKADMEDSRRNKTDDLISDDKTWLRYQLSKGRIEAKTPGPDDQIIVDMVDKFPGIKHQNLKEVLKDDQFLYGARSRGARGQGKDKEITYDSTLFPSDKKARAAIERMAKAGIDTTNATITRKSQDEWQIGGIDTTKETVPEAQTGGIEVGQTVPYSGLDVPALPDGSSKHDPVEEIDAWSPNFRLPESYGNRRVIELSNKEIEDGIEAESARISEVSPLSLGEETAPGLALRIEKIRRADAKLGKDTASALQKLEPKPVLTDETSLPALVFSDSSLPEWDSSQEAGQRKKDTGSPQNAQSEIRERILFVASQHVGAKMVKDTAHNKATKGFAGTDVTWKYISSIIRDRLGKLKAQPGRPTVEQMTKGRKASAKKAAKSPEQKTVALFTKAERAGIAAEVLGMLNFPGQANKPLPTTAPTVPLGEVPAQDIDIQKEEGAELEVPAIAVDEDADLPLGDFDAIQYVTEKGQFGDDPDPAVQKRSATMLVVEMKKGREGKPLTKRDIDNYVLGNKDVDEKYRNRAIERQKFLDARRAKSQEPTTPVPQKDALNIIRNYIRGRDHEGNPIPEKGLIALVDWLKKNDSESAQAEAAYIDDIAESFEALGDLTQKNILGAKRAIRRLVAGQGATEIYGWKVDETPEQTEARKQFVHETVETNERINLPGTLKEKEVDPTTYAVDKEGKPIIESGGTRLIESTRPLLGNKVLIASAAVPTARTVTDDQGRPITEEGKWQETIQIKNFGRSEAFEYIGSDETKGHVFREIDKAGGGQWVAARDRTGVTVKGLKGDEYNDVSTKDPDRKKSKKAQRMWAFLTMDVDEAPGRHDKSVMLYRQEPTKEEEAALGTFDEELDEAAVKARTERAKTYSSDITESRRIIASLSSDLSTLEGRLDKYEQGDPLRKSAEIEIKEKADEIKAENQSIYDNQHALGELLGEPAEGRTIRTSPVPPELTEKVYKTPSGIAKKRINQQILANKRLFTEIREALKKSEVRSQDEMLQDVDLRDPLDSFKRNFLMNSGLRQDDLVINGIAHATDKRGKPTIPQMLISINVDPNHDAAIKTWLAYMGFDVPFSAQNDSGQMSYMLKNMPAIKYDQELDYAKEPIQRSEDDVRYSEGLRNQIVNRNRGRTSVTGGALGVDLDRSTVTDGLVGTEKVFTSESTGFVPSGDPLRALMLEGEKKDGSSIAEEAADIVEALEIPNKVAAVIKAQEVVDREQMNQILTMIPDEFKIEGFKGGKLQSLQKMVIESQEVKGYFPNNNSGYRVPDVWMAMQILNDPSVGEQLVSRFEKTIGNPDQRAWSPMTQMLRNAAKTMIDSQKFVDKGEEVDSHGISKADHNKIVERMADVLAKDLRVSSWEDMLGEEKYKGTVIRNKRTGNVIGKQGDWTGTKETGEGIVNEWIHGSPDVSEIHKSMANAVLLSDAWRDRKFVVDKRLRNTARTMMSQTGTTAMNLLAPKIKDLVSRGKLPETGIYNPDGSPARKEEWERFMLRFLLKHAGQQGMPKIMVVETSIVSDDHPAMTADPLKGSIAIPNAMFQGVKDPNVNEAEEIQKYQDMVDFPDKMPTPEAMTIFIPRWSTDQLHYAKLAKKISDQFEMDTGQQKQFDVGHFSTVSELSSTGIPINPVENPTFQKSDLINALGFEDPKTGSWVSLDGIANKLEIEKFPSNYMKLSAWLGSSEFQYDKNLDFDSEIRKVLQETGIVTDKSGTRLTNIKDKVKVVIKGAIAQYINAQINSNDLAGAARTLERAKYLFRIEEKKVFNKKLADAGLEAGEQAIVGADTEGKKKISSSPSQVTPLR